MYFISRNFQLKSETLSIRPTVHTRHHNFKHLSISNLQYNTTKVYPKSITFQTLLLSYFPLISILFLHKSHTIRLQQHYFQTTFPLYLSSKCSSFVFQYTSFSPTISIILEFKSIAFNNKIRSLANYLSQNNNVKHLKTLIKWARNTMNSLLSTI